MKKCSILFLILLSLIFGSAAYANEGLTAAIKQANDEIFKNHGIPNYFQVNNDKGKPINSDRWLEKERHLFAYGFPYGDTKETPEGTRYRYLGETMSGEEFTNPYFPHDEWREGLKLENFKLYREPWNEVDLKDYKVMGKDYSIEANAFDGIEMYLPSIQRGLEKFWADAIIGKDHPMWSKWHEYVHILQPPTQLAWGLGVAFHKDSRGIIWYVPIPMVPLADLAPAPAKNTGAYSITGCFWDRPQPDGNGYSTYIIRAPMDLSGNGYKLYDIKEPIKSRIQVYLIGPTSNANRDLNTTLIPPESVRELIFDEEVTFTKENPAWVKKFHMPIPPPGTGYGIYVQNDAGFRNDIEKGWGVSASIFNWEHSGVGFLSTYTTSDHINMAWLPWEYIQATYGLSQLPY